ncbi:MAG: SEC-C metal-binding domain-containing protein [Casimicrobiaceae bacterium]
MSHPPTRPGRNDSCPCGSGRKYKQCCGAALAAIPIVTAAAAPRTQPPAAAAPASRACGGCTACCQGWAAGEIRGHAMYPGKHCHFLVDATCTIYTERPVSPCRNFVCGWLGEADFPDDFRPDRLGVIVIRISWRDQPAYLLLSAGRQPDEALLVWMRAFSQRTRRPFFYEHDGEKIGFGPPAFQGDMLARLARGEPMW